MADEAEKAVRYEDVFGDSDLSSDDEEAPKVPVKKAAVAAVSSDDDDDEDEDDDRGDFRRAAPSDSDDDDAGRDDYRPEGSTSASRPTGKKRKLRQSDGESDDQGSKPARAVSRNEDGNEIAREPKRRKPKGERKKKEKKFRGDRPTRQVIVNEDGEEVEVDVEPVYDEATKRRMALDAKIEAAGKSNKGRRVKRREEGDDLMADKLIEDITNSMISAILADINANESGKPAIKKTLLLPKVMSAMQNTSLQESIIESTDFLSAVTQFIEPQKGGALPSLSILKAILGQLDRFDVIDKDILKSSGLGKIVNFYTRTNRVSPDITRQANALIDKWSKPILRAAGIQAGSSAGRRAATGHEEDEGYRAGGSGGVIMQNSEQYRSKNHLKNVQASVRALQDEVEESQKTRRPNTVGNSYTVAPPSIRYARSAEEEAKEQARQRHLDMVNNLKRKSLQGSGR